MNIPVVVVQRETSPLKFEVIFWPDTGCFEALTGCCFASFGFGFHCYGCGSKTPRRPHGKSSRFSYTGDNQIVDWLSHWTGWSSSDIEVEVKE